MWWQAGVLQAAFKQDPDKRTAPLEQQVVHVLKHLRQVRQPAHNPTTFLSILPAEACLLVQ